MGIVALPRGPRTVARPDAGAIVAGVIHNFYVGRLFKAFITIYLVATISFFVVHLMPGSPVEVYIYTLMNQYGVSYATAQNQAAALFSVNVNEPLVQQYVGYLGQLAQGHLGNSLLSPGTSVGSVMLAYMPWTLFSVGVALLISFILGILLGMLMAYRRESVLDHALSFVGSVFNSVPNYIVGILLIVILGIQLNLIDIASMRGSFSPGVKPGVDLHFFLDALMHASLPILTYVLTTVGAWMLTMKSNTSATLDEDYVTVARARGLGDWRIMTSYVGRNAMIPLVAQVAIAAGFAVGGSILIETLFVYQGIGWILNSAIAQRDYTVMQGIFLVITISVVAANLLADLLYGRIDPRVRIQGESGG
ncbi:MAG TPA: ABC transporter permease [Chloroflexota bacterium]|nr:ABC transporter permease [Chloroflexota bacterium]